MTARIPICSKNIGHVGSQNASYSPRIVRSSNPDLFHFPDHAAERLAEKEAAR
jgi:hypothetical protein